ncbi:MAG: hypothetical protein LBM78_02065 [Clostridiales bacterium]|jgi:hypothetical protein|nr:hypothetical protein [Clostridiales bacterium]
MKLIDLDSLFLQYFQAWLKVNAKKRGVKKSNIDDFYDEVYDLWRRSPIPVLDVTPVQYVQTLDVTTAALAAACVSLRKKGKRVPDLLLERIYGAPDRDEVILALLQRDTLSEAELAFAIDVVEAEGIPDALPLLAARLLDKDLAERQQWRITDMLAEEPSAAVRDYLLDAAQRGDMRVKALCADVLVEYKGDDRIYRLLVELLLSGEIPAVYANYLGAYGNEAAIPHLESLLADCDYATFIELRSAIEQLGGVMKVERDFSGDPTYEQIMARGGRGDADIMELLGDGDDGHDDCHDENCDCHRHGKKDGGR